MSLDWPGNALGEVPGQREAWANPLKLCYSKSISLSVYTLSQLLLFENNYAFFDHCFFTKLYIFLLLINIFWELILFPLLLQFSVLFLFMHPPLPYINDCVPTPSHTVIITDLCLFVYLCVVFDIASRYKNI